MLDFTLPMHHLQRWEDESKSSLAFAKTSLEKREFSLQDLVSLASAYENHGSLVKRIEIMARHYQTVLLDAQRQRDAEQRRLGMEALPVEVIGQIFRSACLTPYQSFSMSIPRHSVVGRFSTAHVNRRWRTIALDTPQLWIDIYVTPETPPDYLSFLLSHSRAYAVALSLNTRRRDDPLVVGSVWSVFGAFSAGNGNELDTFPESILALCRNAAPKCHLLNINFRSSEACNSLLAQLTGPSLETLQLSCGQLSFGILHSHALPVIQMPNLKRLETCGSVSEFGSGLTHIRMSCDVQAALQAVASCPQLTKAVFDLVHYLPAGAQPHPVLNQNLRYLEVQVKIDYTPWAVLSFFLKALSLPLLETFSVLLPWKPNPVTFGSSATLASELIDPTWSFDTVAEVIITLSDHSGRKKDNYTMAALLLATCPNAQRLEFVNFAPSKLRKVLEDCVAKADIIPQLEVLLLQPDVLPCRSNTDKAPPPGLEDDICGIVDCWRANAINQVLKTVVIEGRVVDYIRTIGKRIARRERDFEDGVIQLR